MVLVRDLNSKTRSILNVGYVHDKKWFFEMKKGSAGPTYTQTVADGVDKFPVVTSVVRAPLNKGSVMGKVGGDGSGFVEVRMPLVAGVTGTGKLTKSINKEGSETFDTDVNLQVKEGPLDLALALKPVSGKWSADAGLMETFNCRMGGSMQVGIAGSVSGEMAEVSGSPSAGLSFGPPECCAGNGAWKVMLNGNTKKVTSSFWSRTELAALKPTEVAAEVSYDLETKAITSSVGGHVFFTADKSSSLKTRLTDSGKVATAYSQKLDNSLNVTVGAEADLRKETVCYGMKLSFSA